MAISDEHSELLEILGKRFSANMQRHQNIDWHTVKDRLESDPKLLFALSEMERTGGEPDVILYDGNADKYIFADCSIESPSGRRSLCYDDLALRERKEHKPKNSATGMAEAMGIELMTEDLYHKLQQHGSFDLKTSSWLKTPDDVRNEGGAIFGDRRYGRVFIYHNGAQSYYAARGFRGILKV